MAGWWSPPGGRATVSLRSFPAPLPRSKRPAPASCGWALSHGRRVRMGLHTGEARAAGSGQLDHAPINRCARLKAAAHGGQVLVTKTTHDLAGGRLGGGFGLKRLGEFRLRDLSR